MARSLAEAFTVVSILASFLALTSSTEWPLIRCSRNDPNANTCILKAAQISLSKVVNGIPSLRLPPLEPMKLGDKVLTTGAWPISLEVNFKNAILSGVSKVRLDSAKYNKKQHRLDFEGLHKDLKLSAQYVMKGKIFFLPLNNKGLAEISFRNVQCVHSFAFTPRSGVGLDVNSKQKTSVMAIPDMRSLDEMHLNLTAQGLGAYGMIYDIVHEVYTAIRSMEVPSNGGEGAERRVYNIWTYIRITALIQNIPIESTRTLNDLMNSNWRYLYTALKPSIETWLKDVYTNTMDSFFQEFNYDEMFPENRNTN